MKRINKNQAVLSCVRSTLQFIHSHHQSGRRNTDGLVAHRRGTIQPTDGLLHLRLKIDNFLRIQKEGTPLILFSRDMMRMFREKKSDFLQMWAIL